MYEIEVILLTNNVIYPFQQLNLAYVELNKLFASQLIAEHGLGFLINVFFKNSPNSESELIKQIIFDTGGTNYTFLHNLDVYNYPLYDLDTIVLSHWHYDHFGALYKILQRTDQNVNLLTHQDAFLERIFRRARDIDTNDIIGKSKEELLPLISNSKIVLQEAIDVVKVESLNCSLRFNKSIFEIYKDSDLRILISGEIPRKNKLEEFDGFFSLQNNIAKVDTIKDDQCLIFEFKESMIILNGCCHSGFVNVVEFVTNMIKKPITHIIGGFHMANVSQNRIDFTIDFLKKLDNQKKLLELFPIHCSGEKIIEVINNTPFKMINAYNISVGTKFKFINT